MDGFYFSAARATIILAVIQLSRTHANFKLQ